MADASFAQTSFLGGEWSLRMQGRFDRPDYRTALNVCLNSFPTETGTWMRRPGFQFAQTTRGGAAGRVVSLDFQASSSYTMEFTDGWLRFFSGTSLVTTNDDKTIASISTANPAVVTTTVAHGWGSAQHIYFKSLFATCALLQNRIFTITVLSATTFSIATEIGSLPIDGATLGVAGLAAGAKVARLFEVVTPYTAGAWSSVKAIQTLSTIGGVSVVQSLLVKPGTKPQIVTVSSAPTTTNFATFSFDAAVLLDGPYLDAVTTGETLTLSAATGSVTVTASGGSFGGFASTDVGRMIRAQVEPPFYSGFVTYNIGDVVTYPTRGTGGPYWVCIKSVANNTPGAFPTTWQLQPPLDSVAKWVWAIITARNSNTQVVATLQVDSLTYPIAGGTDPGLYSLWRLGVYSDTTGWPTCGTFHEGRLGLAGAVANRFDLSKSNDILNFAPTNHDGSVGANNAISYTLNAPDTNPIFWMIPDLQGIICGTKAGEWLVQAPTTGSLAPNNIAARRITKVGCANIEPRRTEHTLLFVQAFGRKVMEYFADIYSGKFSGPHASFTWKHLTRGGIDEIAYQQELSPTLWMRVKGALVSCTYKRDTLTTAQGPTISAGARHTLGSGRTVESLCVGPSTGGTLDSLSMITNDAVTGVRHVEILTDMIEEGTPYASAWLLDDAVRPSSVAPTSLPSAGAPLGGMTLNGLWHLNGKTVQVWAGGVDCGNRGDNRTTFTDFVVANGSVFVPYGDGISAGCGAGQFTAVFAAAAATAGTIVVGFTYNSDGQIVRPATPQESGARSGPALAKTRRVDKYGLQVENTAGLSIGTSFANLKPVLFKDAGGVGLAANTPFSGVTRDSLGDDYSFDGMICWRVARPYPASVVALAGFLQTQDG